MTRLPRCASAACAVSMLLSTPSARSGAVPSLDHYKIVLKRNVFDPSRRPAPPPAPPVGPVEPVEPVAPPPPPPPPPPPAPPSQFADLHGLLVDGNEAVAFISGSAPEWCGTKRVTVGDEVGPGTVTAADSHALTLEIGDSSIRWRVGKRLRGVGDEWSIEGEAGEPTRVAAIETATGTEETGVNPEPTKPDEAPEPAGSASDILKRLMERRRKEQGL